MRCTQTAPQTVVMTLARTAIIVPADPAKAVAVGTTQNPLLGLTAHASSEPCPPLRSPRVSRVGPEDEPHPGRQASGPSSSPAEVRRQAADQGQRGRRDENLDPQHDGPDPLTGRPGAAPQPTSPPTMNQTRLSTPRLCPLGGPHRPS